MLSATYQTYTYSFTASAASEVLSFTGTPGTSNSAAVLDAVSIIQTGVAPSMRARRRALEAGASRNKRRAMCPALESACALPGRLGVECVDLNEVGSDPDHEKAMPMPKLIHFSADARALRRLQQ